MRFDKDDGADDLATITVPEMATALKRTRSGVYELMDGRGGKRPRPPDPDFPKTFKIGKSRRALRDDFRRYLRRKAGHET